MRGTQSRLIFIDSSVNTHGDRSHISLPPHPFTAIGNDRMSLTLLSMSIRRNWMNLNPTNNTFYIYADSTFYECAIPPGVYSSFAALEVALQSVLSTVVASISSITSITASFIPLTRTFTFTFVMASGHESDPVQIRCYHIKNGTFPTGVSAQGGFSDVHEILGGKPIRSNVDSSSLQVNGLVHGSYYPASLNTLDAIYLHLSTETNNYESTGHNTNVEDSNRVVESSIFARIPFSRSSFDEVHEVVEYQDTNDVFQTFLVRKSLENISLKVTDARGRSLAQLDPTQADNGLMAFRLCLRWDLFQYAKKEHVPPPEFHSDLPRI
jgi:hypothetical protein